MDDASGVAEVDAVDQLEHYQSDLLSSDRVPVAREVFLEILLCELEHQVELLLDGQVDHVHEAGSGAGYRTMLGCGCSSLRIEISRMAVEGTPSSSF